MGKREKKTANEWQNIKRQIWRERDEYYRQFGKRERYDAEDHSEEDEWLRFWEEEDERLALA